MHFAVLIFDQTVSGMSSGRIAVFYQTAAARLLTGLDTHSGWRCINPPGWPRCARGFSTPRRLVDGAMPAAPGTVKRRCAKLAAGNAVVSRTQAGLLNDIVFVSLFGGHSARMMIVINSALAGKSWVDDLRNADGGAAGYAAGMRNCRIANSSPLCARCRYLCSA